MASFYRQVSLDGPPEKYEDGKSIDPSTVVKQMALKKLIKVVYPNILELYIYTKVE